MVDDYTASYRCDTLIVLHGGVIRSRRGLLAVLGETHSGKSTLLSYLLYKGYEFYSDDFIFINTENHSVWSYPQSIRLRTKNLPELAKMVFHLEIMNINNGEKEYLVNAVNEDVSSHPENMYYFIFIERTAVKCEVIELSGIELYRRMLHNLKGYQGLSDWGKIVSVVHESKGAVLRYQTLEEAYRLIDML